jgi:uncharacterized coiled-coil protein SlyX
VEEGGIEREGAYFRRVESRLVALEFKVELNANRLLKLEPMVAELRDSDLVADKLAERMQATRRQVWTKVSVTAALGAMVVPPVLTAVLVRYGFH